MAGRARRARRPTGHSPPQLLRPPRRRVPPPWLHRQYNDDHRRHLHRRVHLGRKPGAHATRPHVPNNPLQPGRHGATFDAASPPPFPSAHSWVFDTPHGRIVIPNAQTTQLKTTNTQTGWEAEVTLRAFPDANNTTTYLYNRTWEETWNDHIAATLEGNTQQAAALLAELAAGFPHYAGCRGDCHKGQCKIP